jgi:CBS domain-containing protein
MQAPDLGAHAVAQAGEREVGYSPMDDSPNPFQDVGRIFPGEVNLTSIAPSTTVTEALRIMVGNRFSQLPVVSNGVVRGVFSHWSLAHHLLDSPKLAPHDLFVEDVMEPLPFVTVQDSLDTVLEHLNRHDAVLVTSPHGLQAVATASDVLNYFDRVARPFVLLQEIELSLRALLRGCLTDAELKACAEHALRSKYGGDASRVPSRLEDMSFEEYRTITSAKENWPLFEGVLGRSRELVASKLSRVRDIRNSIFHFREPVSVFDHETLTTTRNWLLDKTRTRKAQGTEGNS